MANSTTLQLMVDGPRNAVVKYEGVLDTSDLAYTAIIDPATLAGIDNTGSLKATTFRVERINYDVEDGLSVNFFWDAGSPKRIGEYTGRGEVCYAPFGGVSNSATSPTGKIGVSTEGFATGSILSFTMLLHLVKTQG